MLDRLARQVRGQGSAHGAWGNGLRRYGRRHRLCGFQILERELKLGNALIEALRGAAEARALQARQLKAKLFDGERLGVYPRFGQVEG